jgi:hypothetical protein
MAGQQSLILLTTVSVSDTGMASSAEAQNAGPNFLHMKFNRLPVKVALFPLQFLGQVNRAPKYSLR